jgi:ubiquinone/menaquinone biosynthesis C-methylase UbiE
MREINFLERLHTSTKRDYLARVTAEKPHEAEIAHKFGPDYWDGERRFGYGGYHYDGRWKPIAEEMAKFYELKPGDRILDIGCGKGFLMYEFSLLGFDVTGIDCSLYACANSKEEIRNRIKWEGASALSLKDNEFDFVYSINVFHNMEIRRLNEAFAEMQRVGKDKKWFCVESYRTEAEKCNMLNWQLTCESFYRPDAWKYIAERNGYDGDVGFIFFE